MRKRMIIPAFAAIALMATACADKEHQCKCVPEDGDDSRLEILFVGSGVKCEDITETAFEERYVADDGSHSLRRYDVHKVKCRDYRLHD